MNIKDYFLAQQTSAFRSSTFKNICNGTDLYKLSENEEYLEYLKERPQAVLTIPSQYCHEQCKGNLETVKNKLKYKVIDGNDDNFRKPDFWGGQIFQPYGYDTEQLNAVHMFLVANDKSEDIQESYIYLNGFESIMDITETKEALFKGLFGIEKTIKCP